ncbi:MAG: VRR-NUC domain-containing protein [Desulfobulbia bacterium]
MLEKSIEKRCRLYVRRCGGWLVKLTWIKGIPDRMVLLPGGVIFFVEFKRPGEKLRKLQDYRRKQITKMGFTCLVLDSYEDFVAAAKSYMPTVAL